MSRDMGSGFKVQGSRCGTAHKLKSAVNFRKRLHQYVIPNGVRDLKVIAEKET
jgi:hypothetical protein